MTDETHQKMKMIDRYSEQLKEAIAMFCPRNLHRDRAETALAVATQAAKNSILDTKNHLDLKGEDHK